MKRILALCSLLLAVLLCGCTPFHVGLSMYAYEKAADYHVGGAVIPAEDLQDIDTLDVDWDYGCVRLIPENDPAAGLSFEETAEIEITEQWTLRWLIDGSTLHIRFCRAGASLIGIVPDKELTVRVPESLALTVLKVKSASAKVEAEGISAARVSVSTASGAIDLTHDSADEITLSTSSGEVELNTADRVGRVIISSASGGMDIRLGGGADELRLSTSSGWVEVGTAASVGLADFSSSSGDISFNGGAYGSLKIDTSSGVVKVNADSVDEADIDSASGSVFLGAADFSSLDVNTASGRVTLSFPVTAGFTLTFDSASGDLKCDNIPLITKGHTHVNGDGARQITVDTASGDLIIMGRE